MYNINMGNRQDFERFAVQYWGQKVGIDSLNPSYLINISSKVTDGGWVKCLQLRSIDSLTDEELIYAIQCEGYVSEFHILNLGVPVKDFLLDNINTLHANTVDYLRSVGILVPFAQYSCEEIISMGWARIK